MLKHFEQVCADGAVCVLKGTLGAQAVFMSVPILTFCRALLGLPYGNSFLVSQGYVRSLFRSSLTLSFPFSMLNFLLDHQSAAHPYERPQLE